MKKKKYSIRDDFITIRTPADNAKGYTDRSEYAGPWIYRDGDLSDQKRTNVSILLLSLLQTLCTFVGSMRIFEVNWYPDVTFCKILAVIPLVFQLIGTMRFIWQKQPITRMDKRSGDKELGIVPFVTGGLNCLVFLIQLMGAISRSHALSFVAVFATAVSAAAAFVIGALYKRIKYRQERNEIKHGLKEINDKATGRGTNIYVPRHKK